MWNILVKLEDPKEAQSYVETYLLGQSKEHLPVLLNPVFESYQYSQPQSVLA